MNKENYSKEELLKLVERQESIIANFEAVSGLYRRVKNVPLLGKSARILSGVAKSGRRSGIKVINNIKSPNPTLIGVCNPNFSRGVRSATYSICTDVLEVSEIFTRKDATKIAKQIAEYKPEKVVISGYSIGYDLLAEELKKLYPEVRIFAYVHSAFIWFDIYKDENPVFYNFLNLNKLGVIEKIAFCKRDVSEYFKKLGYNTYFLMNRFNLESETHKLSKDKKLKIGIWGANLWHRNILNQVIAALMIPNTEVHVNEIGDQEFIDTTRVVVHGLLSKEKFDKVFEQMDLNLYVSLTDCFPMTLIESMERGIPAIASDTSDVYSFNERLKKDLVVATVDGPIGIADKINQVISNYDEIQKEMIKYLPILHGRVEKSILEFLK